MDDEERNIGMDRIISQLLKIWVKLDDIKNFIAVCKKGFDADIKTDSGEMRSVLAVAEKLLEEVIIEIDQTTH